MKAFLKHVQFVKNYSTESKPFGSRSEQKKKKKKKNVFEVLSK